MAKRIKTKIDNLLLPSQPLVVIQWSDIKSSAGWEYEENAKQDKPAICISIGWLLEKNRTNIVIASDFGEGEWGSRTTIPRGVITAMQIVKL